MTAISGQNRSARIERTASSALRFIFAPQLFLRGSLQPVRAMLIGFVQLIAEFLATAGLIPANHRALRPVTASDARLGEILALALHNVRRPDARMDQYVVFAAVSSLCALVCIMSVYTLGGMLLGTAHAAIGFSFTIGSVTFNFGGPAACTTAGTLFTTGCSNDMAQQWVDALFLAKTPWWIAQANLISPAMQAGLGAMFSTYSSAMLILAGFLVLYHLLFIIAGTAHDGRLGGKTMNQVWAPIRLIAAIGMLVPIGVNGLNSGQMVAIQVTKWGSALASNTWMAFANTFTNSAYVILPPLPQTVPVMKQALLILVCQKSYNGAAHDIEAADGKLPFTVKPSSWYTSSDPQKIMKTWVYQSTATTDRQNGVCGNIEMLNPTYAPSGSSFQFLTSSSGVDASIDIRKSILNVQQQAIDDAMVVSETWNTSVPPNNASYWTETGSTLAKLAHRIYRSADSINSGVTLTVTDILDFNVAVTDYRTAIATGVQAAVAGSTYLAGVSMKNDAMSRGWLSAAVWFNVIAKINGMLIDYTKDVPSVQADYFPMLAPDLTNRARVAMASAYDIVDQLPDMAGATSTTIAEPLSYVEDVSNTSPLDKYMFQLANRVKGLLGNTSASTNEITPGTLPAFASGLTLNTSNPLAELAALGHRMVDAAFAANNAVSQAARDCASSQRALYDNRDMNSSVMSDIANKCGTANTAEDPGASFLIQAISGSMIMAGITLAFVLPLLPFVRFLFGILTWIIAVFETVIAIPIVALAHIRMDGEGFAGSARSAYMLLLQVFLRPVLMVFGLMVALLVFNLMIVALNEFYAQAVRSAEGGGTISALAAVVYTVIYVSLAYGLANASFKAIDMVPNQCLQWIGGATQQSIDGTQYVSQGAGQVGQLSNQAMPALLDRAATATKNGYFVR